MKILLLDCETSPNIAEVWGSRKQNISNNQLRTSSYTLCFAAKWVGGKTMYFNSTRKSGAKRMLRQVHKLMCEADAIITYNGAKFDIPTLNKEFIIHNMPPPSPYRQIDLYRTTRSQFRFFSNKMDFITQILKIGNKLEHQGHSLWTGCLLGKAAAWRTMEAYNKRDVVLLEKLYHRMLPWIKNHPDLNLYVDEDKITGKPQCSHCMGNMQRRGFCYTPRGKYQQFACMKCGVWHRSKRNQAPRRDTQRAVY